MLLFELLGDEQNPIYQAMQAQNNARLHGFLLSSIEAALSVDRPILSQTLIKSFNFHAITTLHIQAGEYRNHQVVVGSDSDDQFVPPEYFRVAALMDDFTNMINRSWERADPIALAATVLWRLNYIHPFVNGNGRAARAAAYFVLCVKLEGLLPGKVILPELLVRNRDDLIAALKAVDAAYLEGNSSLIHPLTDLLNKLISEQIAS